MRLPPWLGLLPALLTIAALFGGGLLLALAQSLGYWPALGRAVLSLDAYRAVLAEPSLTFTTWLAAVSTLASLIVGLFAALALNDSVLGQGVTRYLAQLNLPVPHAVGAVMVLLLFTQSGWFARLGTSLGWIDRPADFPILTHDPPPTSRS